MKFEETEEAIYIDSSYYGLKVFQLSTGEEYAVGGENEFFAALGLYVIDSLWSFSSDFIVDFIKSKKPQYKITTEIISFLQEKLCEDSCDIIKDMINPYMDDFILHIKEKEGYRCISNYDDVVLQTEYTYGLNPGYGYMAIRIN